MDFKTKIRDVTDFPKAGITFKDITPLLQDGPLFAAAIQQLAACFSEAAIDVVAAPEARGFLVGAPVAIVLAAGFVPVRKPGKLPFHTISHHYDLEYGNDVLEMHADAIRPGQRVLLVDDLLATGGTIQALAQMVAEQGGVVAGIAFLVELTALKGREKLSQHQVVSLIKF